MKTLSVISIFIFVCISSCKKPQEYSEIPAINFLEIPVIDTLDQLGNPLKRCKLSFYLIDGDGDIGFNEEDTVAPWLQGSEYYYNILIKMQKKVDGVFLNVDTPEISSPYYFRTKYLQPLGQNKTLKCFIYVNIDFDIPSIWDSVRFEFFVYDRALHKSNTEISSLVVL